MTTTAVGATTIRVSSAYHNTMVEKQSDQRDCTKVYERAPRNTRNRSFKIT